MHCRFHRAALVAASVLLAWLALGFTAAAQQRPASPRPKPSVRAVARHFDTGWWTRSLAAASAFDGATTWSSMRRCPTCAETDPVTRVFIGRRADPWRMALFGSAEVLGTAAIRNKRWRRLIQGGLIVAHVWCGAKNLR